MTGPATEPTVVELLDFEGQYPRDDGRKADAARVRFGLTFGRYLQLLACALDTREALEHDPALVHRLHDRRERIRAARAARIGTRRPRP